MATRGLPITWLWLLQCLWLWTSGVHSRRLSETVRVFVGAPRGFPLYEISPDTLVDKPQASPIHYSLTGPDSSSFMLSGTTIKVDEYPRLTRGIIQQYSISVQVTTILRGEKTLLSVLDLHIIVSEKNEYAPHLVSGEQEMEVFRFALPGHRIGQVEALDHDPIPYNRKLVYSMLRHYLLPVAIEKDTGVLVAKDTLRDAPNSFQVEVKVKDTGSPQLSVRTNITILVRDISEPLNVSIHIVNLSSVEVCWHRPRQGRIESYIIKLETLHEDDITRMMHHRATGSRQCALEGDLRAYEEHWVEIRAANDRMIGVPVKVYFYMEKDFCQEDTCGHGKCLQTLTEPGYKCVCDGGVEGLTCPDPVCPGPDCQASDTEYSCICDLPRRKLSQQCRDQCYSREPKSCNNGGTLIKKRGLDICVCAKGYHGPTCQMFDPCATTQCLHGGTCRNISSTQYKCECLGGHFGELCEHFDLCYLEPCKNGGYCKNVSDSEYYCYCYYGYYGQNCTHYDPCASAPCQNNGVCRNISDSSYMCKCKPGFYGQECEMYNPCLEDPCLYGGMCNSIDGKIVCECIYGRFGPRCEHVNLCLHRDPCGEHAVKCHNMSDSTYKCVCEPGWSGENCSTFDPCFNKPCLHGGRCRRAGLLDYRCHCELGYYGDNCEFFNHCQSDPCKNGGTCSNTSMTDYVCHCAGGYFGRYCEQYNPCSRTPCMNEGLCVNTSSINYKCICSSSFYGDLCQFYNMCSVNPCVEGKCTMQNTGEYMCTCEPGYSGENCDIYDPCSTQPCRNGGSCFTLPGQKFRCLCREHYKGAYCQDYDACHSSPCQRGDCINVDGSTYHCLCPKGKFGDRCESTDPCADNPCQNGGTCYSVDRKHFSCSCDNGFYGEKCESYNPCVSSPCLHGSTCNHKGHNLYTCDCSMEFQGENCQDEIPCNSHGKRCYNDGKCKMHHNGTVYCGCLDGYFGFRCEKFNPCSSENACLNGGTCDVLMNGMYRCDCHMGFFGDRCEYHQPCSQYICKNNGTCVHSLEGNLCYCKPGFSGKLCEFDLDECMSDPCIHGATCVDRPGRFICMCPEGFTGQYCNNTKLCPEESLHTARGTFHWPSTGHSETVRLACSRNHELYATRLCSLDVNHRAMWELPNIKACGLNIHSPEEAVDALEPFTNATVALRDAYEVAEAVKLMDITIRYTYNWDKVAAAFLNVVDELLDLPVDVLFKSNSTKSIMTLLDKFIHNVQLKSNITVTKRNFEIRITPVSWKDNDMGSHFSPRDSPDVEFFVPPEVFQSASAERVCYVYFKSSKLFHASDASPENWEDTGHVVTVRISYDTIKNLSHCVKYTMPNKYITENNRCVFWDKKDGQGDRFIGNMNNRSHGPRTPQATTGVCIMMQTPVVTSGDVSRNMSASQWSSEALETVFYRGFHTKCCSSHLTSFSVINSPGIAAMTAVEEDWYLVVASHTGQSIAIFCLSAVLFTYSIFRTLNKENFGQLIIQMSGSMLFMNVCILLGHNKFQVNNDEVCFGVALLTHYFQLASVMWACITGHHLTKLLQTEHSRVDAIFLCKRCLAAWGLPFVPIGIALAVNINSYRSNPISCYISPHEIYTYCSLYVTPSLIGLLANGVFFLLLVRTLCRETEAGRKGTPIGLSQILGVLCTQALIGLSWLVAYISMVSSVADVSIYFTCIHFLLNGLLGFFILLFHVLLRKDARSACLACCAKNKSYVNSRRRVAGKTAGSNPSALKTETDYTLVINRPAGAGSCDSTLTSVSRGGAQKPNRPDLSSTETVHSSHSRPQWPQRTEDSKTLGHHHTHSHTDGATNSFPAYRAIDTDSNASSPAHASHHHRDHLHYHREPGANMMYSHKHVYSKDYDTQYNTVKPRRSIPGDPDGLINTRV